MFAQSLVKSLFQNTQGRFVGITFTKLNGEVRSLNGIVEKVGSVVLLKDVKNGGFRNVRPSSITSVRIDGVEVLVK